MTEASAKDSLHVSDISKFLPPSPQQEKATDFLDVSVTSGCRRDKSPAPLENIIPTPDSTPTKETGLAKLRLDSPVRGGQKPSKSNSHCRQNDSAKTATDTNDLTCSNINSGHAEVESPRPTQAKLSRNEIKPGKKSKSSHTRRKGKGKKVGAELKGSEEGIKNSSNIQTAQTRGSRNTTKTGKEPVQSHLLTEYFPVRRSSRRTKSDVQKEKQEELEEAILSKKAEGLKVEIIEGKGRGVVSSRPFKRGEFIVEYEGDLVDLGTAKGREKRYQDNPELGCYMYYFSFRNKNYCVDATAETGRLGRLLNHSRLNPNCKTQVVGIGDQPYLILVAARDIKEGEELMYDYGDRSKSSLESHPWLAT